MITSASTQGLVGKRFIGESDPDGPYNEPRIPKQLAIQAELVNSIAGLFGELNGRLTPILKPAPSPINKDCEKEQVQGGMLGDLIPTTRQLERIRDSIQETLRTLDI